jgi:hypothetical protein
MGALSSTLRSLQGGRVGFWCPGCGEAHWIGVGAGDGPRWGYNGNPEQPTFTPSILVCGVRLDMGDAELDRILDSYKLPEDRERMLADRRINTVCHSFVTDGRIQFLGDCTHALAGQTVDLPPFPHGKADAADI